MKRSRLQKLAQIAVEATVRNMVYSTQHLQFLVFDARDISIKVDYVLARERLPVKCICAYSGKTGLSLYSSVERGEDPQLFIQKTTNEKRGEEVQVVLMGPFHVEELEYFKKDPKDWKSFGHIVMSVGQAKQLAVDLWRITEAKAKQQTLNPTEP